MTLTHKELMARDRAEEKLRERRLEELARDETQCRCGQWYPKAEGVSCEICLTVFCPACLEPAHEPVGGTLVAKVCEACRENINTINAALALHSRREQIAECIQETLDVTGDESQDVHFRLGLAEGSLKALRDGYGLQRAG